MVSMKIKKWLLDVLKGASLGLGMIPGVSAGTMALITGIYKRLIGGISELFRNFKKSFFSLLPLGIGAVISVLAIMIGIHYGFHYAPVAIVSLFAGIVLGFSPLITKEIKNQKKTAKPILIMIISAIFAALIGILSVLSKFYWNLDLEDAFRKGEWWVYIAVFASGFIAAAACIVPGISGSMILFIFGLYTPILNVFLGEGSMFHNHERIGSGIGILCSLLIGIALGFLLTSKAMKRLLEKHHDRTFDVVIGFVFGSVISMFFNQEMVVLLDNVPHLVYETTKAWEWIVAIILLIASFIACFVISKKVIKTETVSTTLE